MDEATRRPGRLEGLDGLRGIAAMSVMLYHYTAWFWERAVANHAAYPTALWLPYGNFGVELFFIISGFAIFMTLQRTPSLYLFATARFARLYPAFVTCLLTTIVITLALHHAPGRIDAPRVIANLTMMPFPLGQDSIDDSYWSLRYEIDFYLLAAVVYLVLRVRAPELPCAIWLAGELVLRGWVGATPRQSIMDATHTTFAHLFVIGIMLYRLYARQATWLTVPLLVGGIAMAMFGPHTAFKPLPLPIYVAMIGGFALLVWIATTRAGRVLGCAPLRLLGRISYPLYLIHQAAGVAVLATLTAAGVDADLAVVITVGSAILLAWVISTAVEWPAQRWLRSWFASDALRPAARLR